MSSSDCKTENWKDLRRRVVYATTKTKVTMQITIIQHEENYLHAEAKLTTYALLLLSASSSINQFNQNSRTYSTISHEWATDTPLLLRPTTATSLSSINSYQKIQLQNYNIAELNKSNYINQIMYAVGVNRSSEGLAVNSERDCRTLQFKTGRETNWYNETG